MNCRWFSVVPRIFLAFTLFFYTCCAWAQEPEAGDTGRRLVLVADARSSIETLTVADIRKLFIGVDIERNGKLLIPLRNQTNSVLHEVFLQKVMFMSGPMYERTLLTRLLRNKGTRPQVYETETALLQALHANPNAVTYMWATQAEQLSDLRIIIEIWHE